MVLRVQCLLKKRGFWERDGGLASCIAAHEYSWIFTLHFKSIWPVDVVISYSGIKCSTDGQTDDNPLNYDGQKGVKIWPWGFFAARTDSWNVHMQPCQKCWLSSDSHVTMQRCHRPPTRPTVPWSDLSQGSLLTLITLTIRTILSIWISVWVWVSYLAKVFCSGRSHGQPSDGGPDGAEAEGRDVSTSRWLRSGNQRAETSCWLSAKNVIYSVWVSMTGWTSNVGDTLIKYSKATDITFV